MFIDFRSNVCFRTSEAAPEVLHSSSPHCCVVQPQINNFPPISRRWRKCFAWGILLKSNGIGPRVQACVSRKPCYFPQHSILNSSSNLDKQANHISVQPTREGATYCMIKIYYSWMRTEHILNGLRGTYSPIQCSRPF